MPNRSYLSSLLTVAEEDEPKKAFKAIAELRRYLDEREAALRSLNVTATTRLHSNAESYDLPRTKRSSPEAGSRATTPPIGSLPTRLHSTMEDVTPRPRKEATPVPDRTDAEPRTDSRQGDADVD